MMPTTTNDAWSVLGLEPSVSDQAIRQRYLQLVREFSPEHAPQRFTEIRKAYDELRDPIERVRKRLFTASHSEQLDGLIAEYRQQASVSRIPTAALLNLGKGA